MKQLSVSIAALCVAVVALIVAIANQPRQNNDAAVELREVVDTRERANADRNREQNKAIIKLLHDVERLKEHTGYKAPDAKN